MSPAKIRPTGFFAIRKMILVPYVSHAMDLFFGIMSADGGRSIIETLGRNKRDPRVAALLFMAQRSRPTLAAIGGLLRLLGQHGMAGSIRNFGYRDTLHYWQLVEEQMEYQHHFLQALDHDEGGPFDLILCPACALPFPEGYAPFFQWSVLLSRKQYFSR